MNPCLELNGMAERELTSFYAAVKKMFGREEAERSAKEWIGEISSAARVPRSLREWREISVNVAKRVALRLETVGAA
ncbi:hypothetical protein [Candidatus Korobacter versatilis]|nr:hypothetical protein [Candidatus Koribacter versatilis]